MVDIQHTAFTSSEVHEPKHISINGTGQSGRVITNSGSVAATSEYRKLTLSDLDEVEDFVSFMHPNATTTETNFLVSPISGVVVGIRAIIDNPVVTANLVYSFAVDGVAITPATMTFTLAGSLQGESQTITPSSGGTVAPGSSIEITGNGGNTDANVSTHFVVTIRRP